MTFLQKHHGQMSDSMLTAFFIILSGGLQDAYTYCCRGKVFANAQTGNIVLLSTHLFEGDWGQALRYLVPVLAFLLGIYIAECVHRHFKRMEKVHWRQLIILAEIVLLAAVGFLPETLNTTANAVVSFVCAMQVQTFRKVRGSAFATTMCTGNLRSGTEQLVIWRQTGDRGAARKMKNYYSIILVFILGGAIGALMTNAVGEKALLLTLVPLVAVFLIMFIEEEREELEEEISGGRA